MDFEKWHMQKSEGGLMPFVSLVLAPKKILGVEFTEMRASYMIKVLVSLFSNLKLCRKL